MFRREYWALSVVFATTVLLGCQKTLVDNGAQLGSQPPVKPVTGSPQSGSPSSEPPSGPQVNSPGTSPTEASYRASQRASTPSASTRVARHGFPERPKADETASREYKTSDESGVEVEGICNITETSIGCWNADGSDNADLAGKVRAAFEKQQTGGGSPISFRYGKKNRLVVFKLTEKMGRDGRFMVESIGSDPGYFGGGMYLELDQNRFQHDQPFSVRHDVKMVSEESSARSTTARIRLFTAIPEPGTIENRVGATATFGGEKHTIVAIKKGVTGFPPGMMREDKRPTWGVTLKSTHGAGNPISVGISPLDASGQPIHYVDEQGNPVTMEQYRKQMEDSMKEMQEQRKKNPRSPVSVYPEGKFRSAMGSGGMGTVDGFTTVLLVNPAKVSKFRLSGNRSKAIDISDIPLDPR